jgi:hypothetical protein
MYRKSVGRYKDQILEVADYSVSHPQLSIINKSGILHANAINFMAFTKNYVITVISLMCCAFICMLRSSSLEVNCFEFI